MANKKRKEPGVECHESFKEWTSTPFNIMNSVVLHKLLERACIHCLHFLTFHSFLNTLNPAFVSPCHSLLSFRSPVTFLIAKPSDFFFSPSQPPGPAALSPEHLPTSSSLHCTPTATVQTSVSFTLTYCNSVVPCLSTSRPVPFTCFILLL